MKIVGFILAILFVIAFALGAGVLANRISYDLSGEVALGAATFIATTWFAIWSFQKTKRKEAEAQLFPQKAAVYKKIVDLIRDIFFAQKGWGPAVAPDALAQRFGEVRFEMIIWAGQDTIRAITAMEEADPSNPGSSLAAAVNLYAQIRRELGHKDDPALAEELLLSQVIASDREQVRKLIKASK